MKFMIAKKLGSSRLFQEDGTVVPVTLLAAGPITVTQVKTAESDGYCAVQVGFGARQKKNISQSVLGHLGEMGPFAILKEFRLDGNDQAFERGQRVTLETFAVGDHVDVVGTSKGRGFAGVVKRHKFAGSPASHGHKDQLRMPGSIGSQAPQHVFKGTRMGGHMGAVTVTVKNLEVVDVDVTAGILKIKGAVPGPRGGFVTMISAKNG